MVCRSPAHGVTRAPKCPGLRQKGETVQKTGRFLPQPQRSGLPLAEKVPAELLSNLPVRKAIAAALFAAKGRPGNFM